MMPPKPANLERVTKPRAPGHRTERCRGFGKVVISDVRAKEIERRRRQCFALGPEPSAITFKVEFPLFALVPHRIDHQQRSVIAKQLVSQLKKNGFFSGGKMMQRETGEDKIEFLAALRQTPQQIALMQLDRTTEGCSIE